jgi:replication factor C large subunit
MPWTQKYRPKSVPEFVDNEEALSTLEKWLTSWKLQKPTARAAFLFGPSGVGKSESVILIAKKLGFDLIEMSASDQRTKEDISRVAGIASSESSLFGQPKIILLDELEGLSGTADRGGLSAILSLTQSTSAPLVLIATDMWDRRFASFRKSSLFIEFKRIATRSIMARLKNICEEEGINADDEAIRAVAERSNGDLRSAITDLQALAQGKRNLTYQDVSWLDSRDRQEPVFEALKNIFNATSCAEARRAATVSQIDYEMLFEWLYENVPYQIPDKKQMYSALMALSRADIFLARIRREQEWGLLPYAIEDMVAGIAMSRNNAPKRWISFKFPQRIMAMSRSKLTRELRNGIGQKVGRETHLSSAKTVTDVLPYLRIVFQSNKALAHNLAESLQLDQSEVDYLSE